MLVDELEHETTPLFILAPLEVEPRHGCELSRLLEQRSRGVVRVHAASRSRLLVRLDADGRIRGRWVEQPGRRRRRYYSITAEGKRELQPRRLTCGARARPPVRSRARW